MEKKTCNPDMLQSLCLQVMVIEAKKTNTIKQTRKKLPRRVSPRGRARGRVDTLFIGDQGSAPSRILPMIIAYGRRAQGAAVAAIAAVGVGDAASLCGHPRAQPWHGPVDQCPDVR